MTHRERFSRTVRFQSVDNPPLWEFDYWDETLERWYSEGLPKDVSIIEFFGLDSATYFEADKKIPHFFNNVGIIPPFRKETIEETKEYRIYIDEEGITKKVFKAHDKTFMPQWLKFPIENKEDWQRFRKRLSADSPSRYPSNWNRLKEGWKHRDYPLVIYVGSSDIRKFGFGHFEENTRTIIKTTRY